MYNKKNKLNILKNKITKNHHQKPVAEMLKNKPIIYFRITNKC
jgi:hypothetical protein